MNDSIGTLLLSDMLREFTNQRNFAERAMSQLDDTDFFRALDDEENSVAIIVKHVGGNLRSRWTDFLTTDGEKPERNRDGEFEDDAATRAEIMDSWEKGFAALESTLQTLSPSDLLRIVQIRKVDHTVVQALNRSLAHTSQHTGQIILLSKHFRGARWETISIPRAPKSRTSTQQ